jgi:hypothetical protein
LLSLHPDQELDRIAAGLSGAEALALLRVEAEPLERIERRCGGQAYRSSMDGLMNLVGEPALRARLPVPPSRARESPHPGRRLAVRVVSLELELAL